MERPFINFFLAKLCNSLFLVASIGIWELRSMPGQINAPYNGYSAGQTHGITHII